jgi:uncharacterized repeat protein (TIGR03803 family)
MSLLMSLVTFFSRSASAAQFKAATRPILLFLLTMVFGAALTQAQSFQVLYTFTGKSDGGGPYGGLIRDSSGNLYGTAPLGGSFKPGYCRPGGCGVVFKLDPSGMETVLDTFKGSDNGSGPYAGLTRDRQGNFYGVTAGGGLVSSCPPSGCGIVFKIDAAGNATTLYEFIGGATDGSKPQGALILDAAGNLYGTTVDGGSKSVGTVFKVDPTGKETVLHSFQGTPDGATPLGALLRDPQGNLYGTTQLGGTGKTCGFSCGTVFKISPVGEETVIYSFTGGEDGLEPASSLLRDSEGNLYGTTSGGGDSTCDPPFGCGVVFKLSPSGGETVLHKFTGADGSDPSAGVIRDAEGDLYGTTYEGGAFGVGTVYKLDAARNESVLYSFTGGTDGGYPKAGLTADPAGNLYGTTVADGNKGCGQGCGTVFKVVP